MASIPVTSASSLPHSIVIEGPSSHGPAEYTFSVSEAVEPDPENGAIEGHDNIKGSTVLGKVAPDDVDAYRFSGSITSMDVSSRASITITFEDTNSSPVVEHLSGVEVETDDADAEFDVDWSVSDPDGNLSSVDLTLIDDSDGSKVDSVTRSVSGDTTSGTTRLVATDDDGAGHSYTVEAVVWDSDGVTDSATASLGETENSSATVDSLSGAEVETDDADAEFDVDWSVSDPDGNLASVDLTLIDDSDDTQEDAASMSVSGDTASGTTRQVAAADDGAGHSYTVEAVVTDTDGAGESVTTTITETESTSTWSGFTWDQTHVDTSWVETADANDNLTVETITTLDATGEGSLNAALDAAENNDNTLIVFEVGGVIDTGGETYIRSFADNVYIAGQTAPYPGITVVRGGLRIHGSNTIVEHITCLPGNDVEDLHKARAFTVNDYQDDILFNHCTAGWAPDTNIDIHNDVSRVAYINGIDAEALLYSSHPEAPHSYGTLLLENASPVAFLGNLRPHVWKRNPGAKAGGNLTWAANYTYNWGKKVFTGFGDSGPTMDWAGNVVESGSDTDPSEGIFADFEAAVYWDSNNEIIPSDVPMNDQNVTYVDTPQTLPSSLSLSDIPSSDDLESFLVSVAGPRPADRAPNEQRLINDFQNRTGTIIDGESDVGGYPSYSSNTRALDPPNTGLLDWLQQYTDAVV
jgi:hypothetical protein